MSSLSVVLSKRRSSWMKNRLEVSGRFATLVLVMGLLCPRPALADYVGELETTKYFDQTTVDLITTRAGAGTGLLAGDEVSYFIQFTPTDNGGSIGAGGFVTDYIPAGTKVVNAQFVRVNPDGSYTQIAPPSPPAVYPGFVPMYSDTGIFYSTDARTSAYPANTPITASNGYALAVQSPGCTGISLPSSTHNAWDKAMVTAFAAVSAPSAGASCASPPSVTYTTAGLSPVAGPDSYLTKDSTGAVGPWQRISYPGSMKGTASGVSVTGYSNGATVSNACVGGTPTAAGWNLSSANPLPANTTAVRFAAGKVVVGEIFSVRITLKLTTNMPASGIVNNSDVFGGDASLDVGNAAAHPSALNQWRYYCPAVAASNAQLLLLKTLVGACAGSGCTPTTLNAGVVPTQSNLKLRYQIQFLNTSSSAQTGVVLTDTLASGGAYVAGSYVQLSGSGPGAPSGATVLTFPTMANLGSTAGGKIQYDVNYATLPGSPDGVALINVAKLTSTQLPTGVTSKAIATYSSQANLWIGKSTSTSSVAPGNTVSYTITVPNSGGGNATSVVVNDFLPSAGGSTAASRFSYVVGSAVATVTNAAGTVTAVTPVSITSAVATAAPYTGLNREKVIITLPAATAIPTFGKLTITFSATVGANVPSSATPYLNDANVGYAGGPGGTNANTSLSETIGTAPVTVTAPMSLTVTVACVYAGSTCVPYTNGTIAPGSKIRYQMNYKNISGAALGNVVLANTLPAGVSFVTGTGLLNGSSAFAPTVAGQLLTFGAITTLAPGSSGYVTFDAQLGASIVSGNDITDVANITATGFPAGVQASVTISVRDQANLQIVKTVSPATIQVGGTVTYAITVSNTGNAVASGIQIFDELPFNGATADITQRFNFNAASNTFATTDTAAAKLVAVAPTAWVPPTFPGYTLQTNQQELVWTFAPSLALAVGQSFTLTYTATAGANVAASATPYTSDVQAQYISATNTMFASTVNTAPVTIGGLDHIALSFSTTGLSCVPQAVTVQACGNAACSTPYAGGVSGNVVGSVGASTLSTTAFSIPSGSSSATISVSLASPPSMTLGVSSLSASPGGSLTCNGSTATCSVTISACVGGANFNCQDSSIAGYGSASARLYTKLAGTAFTFDVVALNAAGAQESNYVASGAGARSVTVELFDASAPSSCSSYSSPLASQSISFGAANGGRVTIAPVTLASAYRQLICRVTDASSGSVVSGCSSDQFSVRPSAATLVTAAVAAAPSVSAAPAIKTGASFSLSTTTSAGSGYAGTLTLDTSKLTAQITSQVASVQSGGSVGTLTPSSLVANAASVNATYSEVGYLYLAPGAYRDDSFTAASGDSTGGDCISAATDPVNFMSDTLIGGKYGCSIGNKVTVSLGRFIPDHFDVSVNANGAMAASCPAGGFTYTGQPMTYGAAALPSLTIRPMNAAAGGAVTQNYQGLFQKLTAAGVSIAAPASDATQLGKDAATKTALASSMSTGVVTGSSGTLTYTLAPNDTFTYTRDANSLVGPYTTAIALPVTTVSDGEVSAAGILPTLNPTGTSLRYGRLQMQNAYGSELQPLSLPVQAQYWTGSYYVTNTADSCTTLFVPAATTLAATAPPTGAAGLYFYPITTKNLLASGNTNATLVPLTLASGVDKLLFTAPGVGHSGWVDIVLTAPSYLPSNLENCRNTSGTPAGPCARATFGIYKSPLIYRRENY